MSINNYFLNQNMFRNYYGHNLIGLQHGELLMICGTDIDAGFADTSNVWRLSENAWSLNGNMIQVRFLMTFCYFFTENSIISACQSWIGDSQWTKYLRLCWNDQKQQLSESKNRFWRK